jgi:hypothetical protein
MTEGTCENCAFFQKPPPVTEQAAKAGFQRTAGRCRRFPREEDKEPYQGCGEFQKARQS